MIPHEGSIWMARDPVDMRKGVEGLSAVVRDALGKDPCTDGAFLFRNKNGDRIKILLWDGNGVWLLQRRLHQGRFTWVAEGCEVFSLGRDEWEWLFRGADWRRLHASPSPLWEA
jgi:transposase